MQDLPGLLPICIRTRLYTDSQRLSFTAVTPSAQVDRPGTRHEFNSGVGKGCILGGINEIEMVSLNTQREVVSRLDITLKALPMCWPPNGREDSGLHSLALPFGKQKPTKYNLESI